MENKSSNWCAGLIGFLIGSVLTWILAAEGASRMKDRAYANGYDAGRLDAKVYYLEAQLNKEEECDKEGGAE
jgi:hypothetical protein